ncbi:ribosomal RNA-processing protein 1 [Cyanidiococcus yangmingshanensis]|uniref:Ribosomal RNA-processing protein 1 n=1 Tax=Cyanidiococcus yangmingshanensis TaxID=2690220 RepID=A0A7J7INJ2_9RHOD|nr:ribosomal RNA-processing protein 1 [Cyanidiococcus yangmingshanensis]
MRRLWRALYYLLWFADSPPLIDRTIERLCSWMRVSVDTWLYFQVLWETVCRYWLEIDHLRLDKYYALLNRALGMAFEEWRHLARIIEQVVLGPVAGTSTTQTLNDSPNALGVALHLCDKWLDTVLLQTPGGPRTLTFMSNSDRPADLVMEPFLRLYVAESERASVLQLRNRKLLMQRAFDRIWQPLVRPPPSPPLSTGEHSKHPVYLTDTEHRQQLATRLFKRAAGASVPPLGRKLAYACVRWLHREADSPMSDKNIIGRVMNTRQRRRRRRGRGRQRRGRHHLRS